MRGRRALVLTAVVVGLLPAALHAAHINVATIDGSINNTATGLVNIDAATTFSETNGVYNNNGTIDIASTPAEPAVRTLFIINNGQFTSATPGNIAGGGIINFMGSADFFATGNIEADVIIGSGSTMNPGDSPGIANEDDRDRRARSGHRVRPAEHHRQYGSGWHAECHHDQRVRAQPLPAVPNRYLWQLHR